MITLVPFAPNANLAPPFTATFVLDGAQYAATATWSVYAQRWYLTLADQQQNLIWHGALVGSPIGFDIPLAPGIFATSTLVYR